MNRKIVFIGVALSITALLSGCAATTGANHRPIIDSKGVDFNRYEADLRDCQAYATQAAGAADSAVSGAVAGAVLGAVLAAAAGSQHSRTAAARVGAVGGAVGAGLEGDRNQRTIINRCLSGRGYSVLQ